MISPPRGMSAEAEDSSMEPRCFLRTAKSLAILGQGAWLPEPAQRPVDWIGLL